ncbi:MarR family transcriptional regulator [Saccharospirillum sp. MSK14-1]|uniref:MarR family winged helix-turn-helix transcriptional regulator n=1 Tax=Saccharospirillum sp. MSK14-1 TaxID=1897632 RepID=UPI000D36F3A5|nr:MarR family transcriptional regulator [Saccharospirillum sp. MSK14-1]PTY37868.1 MarR family transcriptional regulator [Saccharospirillum sp. MSK14-1]
MKDGVDSILEQWQRERPDVDTSPMGVIGRLARLERRLSSSLSKHFAEHGLQSHEFDILATLRRSGAPYRLTAGQLTDAAMVTSGAITNRIDRLVDKGWVTRETDPNNRRSVRITLSKAGLDKVDRVLERHAAREAELLAGLSEPQQAELAHLLRTLLVSLGDEPI